jgi:hypothetical protein
MMAAMIEKMDLETTAPPASGAELKRRLVEHLDMLKRPNDIVRITQVSTRHFRVNTLSPRMEEHAVMQTYRIVKSQFLLVEDRNGELVITDQTRH